MSLRVKIICVLFAFAVAYAPSSMAQKGMIEVGIDGEILMYIPDSQNGIDPDNVFFIDIPINTVRVGFYLSDAVSIEPSLSLSFLSSDGDSFTQLGLAAGLLYHFTSGDGAAPFVGVSGALGLMSFGGDDSDSASQFSLLGRAGVLLPAGENLAIRLAAGVERDFETEEMLGGLNIFGQVGLSFFIAK